MGVNLAVLWVISVRAEIINWYERKGFQKTNAFAPFPPAEAEVGTPLRDDLQFVRLEKRLSTPVSEDACRSPDIRMDDVRQIPEELNQFDSIVIDPSLHEDRFFWQYLDVVTVQGECTLHCLGPEEGDSWQLMTDAGIPQSDLEYNDVFEYVSTSEPTGKHTALIIAGRNIGSLKSDIAAQFQKVITVGEIPDGDVNPKSGVHSDANIAVLNLSELRAMTICGYAIMAKQS
jgi:hypothetical protein